MLDSEGEEVGGWKARPIGIGIGFMMSAAIVASATTTTCRRLEKGLHTGAT